MAHVYKPPTGSTRSDVKKVLEECLRNPGFHRKQFQDLRAALQALHGGAIDNPTPACGTVPPFRTRMIAQLRNVKNVFVMWNPEDDTLSQRATAFEANGLRLVTSLLGNDELKIEVGDDNKPVRVAGLVLRKDDEKEVNKKLEKKFIVHLSCPKLVSKEVVEKAYNEWLCMFHATVEVIEAAKTPQSTKEVPDPASRELHVYVEERNLDDEVGKGVPASSFLPNWDPLGEGNVNTIYISPAILGYGSNIQGCLTHEVGHTLGFAHEFRLVSNCTYGSSQFAEHTPYFKIDKDGKPELVTAANEIVEVDASADTDSVMWYPKMLGDIHSKSVSRLSAEDKRVCKLLYGLPKDQVDEYPKPPQSQSSSSSSAAAAPSSAPN